MKKVYLTLIIGLSGLLSTNAQCPVDARFTSSAPSCTNYGVNFYSAGSVGGGITHFWDFGAGAVPATSTVQDPVGVVYSTPGARTITHTTTNSLCAPTSDTRISIITINSSPISTFTTTAPQCTGNGVDFTNTGTAGVGIIYFWDFGTGATPATSTAQNESGVMYSTAGTKTITLVVKNQFGCFATSTSTISINQTPTASFSSTAPGCTGANVNFTNTGTTTGVTWLWNFGAGATPATSTLQNPAGVVYTTAGTKSVTLTTTNTTTSCTATAMQTININQTPAPAFTSNAPQCTGAPLTFSYTGTSGTGWTYAWDFGTFAYPTTTSSAQNPGSVIYLASAGTKTITITVTNNGTCPGTATQTIVVNQAPAASFSSTAPACTGLSVGFTNTGTTAGVSWLWNFGAGATPATSTVQNPTGVVYSTAGTKGVTLTITNTSNTCTATQGQTININQTPNVSFTSTAPRCAMTGVNFTNTGSTGTNWSYAWTFGQNASPASSTSQNPTGVIYSGGGTKQITLTIADQFCTKTDTQTVQIIALPIANAGKDTTICANTKVMIGTAAIAGNTYSWFAPSTLSSASTATTTASPIAPVTMYIVTVTNTASTCSNKDTVIVSMLAPLIANAGVDGAICRYDSIQVGTGLINGQVYSWSPSAGLGNATISNPVSSPSVTTTYTLTVTSVAAGCAPVRDQVTIIVHPLPRIYAGVDDTITKGSSVQLIATGGVQYIWSPATGLSNTGIYNPVASPISTATYIVTGTDIYGCKNNDTIIVWVKAPSVWLPNAFTPNGDNNNDVLYVRGEGIKDFEFGIFNRWGEQIYYSKDSKAGWDGTRQSTGEKVPEGAYVYIVKGTLSNGQPIPKDYSSGLVNLIR